jgi:hypothetical protein
MFGSVEDLTFEQWWLCKGVEKFGSGCIGVAPLARTDYCSVKGVKDESKKRGVPA